MKEKRERDVWFGQRGRGQEEGIKERGRNENKEKKNARGTGNTKRNIKEG